MRERFDRPVRWVVNTHAHFDHTFGNQVFGPGTATDASIHGHANIAAHFAEYEEPRLAAWREDPTRESGRHWHGVRLTPPTHPVGSPTTLDLGGRIVELLPQPPAHTDTDLVVFAPAERVWIVGDLVEESGPPMYGSGSFPLQWPGVLAALAASMAPRDLVVPGHGRVVDRAFVAHQAGQLQLVADRIRAAHDDGLTAAEALARHQRLADPARLRRECRRTGLHPARSDVAVDVVPATPFAGEATRLVQLAALAIGAIPGGELDHAGRVERGRRARCARCRGGTSAATRSISSVVGRVDGCHVASRYSAAPVANAV